MKEMFGIVNFLYFTEVRVNKNQSSTILLDASAVVIVGVGIIVVVGVSGYYNMKKLLNIVSLFIFKLI